MTESKTREALYHEELDNILDKATKMRDDLLREALELKNDHMHIVSTIKLASSFAKNFDVNSRLFNQLPDKLRGISFDGFKYDSENRTNFVERFNEVFRKYTGNLIDPNIYQDIKYDPEYISKKNDLSELRFEMIDIIQNSDNNRYVRELNKAEFENRLTDLIAQKHNMIVHETRHLLERVEENPNLLRVMDSKDIELLAEASTDPQP